MEDNWKKMWINKLGRIFVLSGTINSCRSYFFPQELMKETTAVARIGRTQHLYTTLGNATGRALVGGGVSIPVLGRQLMHHWYRHPALPPQRSRHPSSGVAAAPSCHLNLREIFWQKGMKLGRKGTLMVDWYFKNSCFRVEHERSTEQKKKKDNYITELF